MSKVSLQIAFNR